MYTARQVFRVICKGKQKNEILVEEDMLSQGTGFAVVFLKMGDVLACLYADKIAPVKRREKLVIQETTKMDKGQFL